MKRLFLKFAAVAALCCAAGFVHAGKSDQWIDGVVVYVDDGDTVTLLVNSKDQWKIRLSSIDAPESSHTKQEKGRIGQPFSKNSMQYLETMVKGKLVKAHCFEQDRYGRDVCELFLGPDSVNQRMVAAGWAWANTSGNGRYLRDKSLPSLQAMASEARIGLWQGKVAVEPWDWRKSCWKENHCPN